MSTLTFVVEQAPMALGYALYSVALGVDAEGKPQMAKQVIAFKTTLIEISLVRAQHEKEAFGTEALPQPEKHVVYMQPAQIPAAQPQNGSYPEVPLPPHDRPKVLHDIEYPPETSGEPSTLDKIKQAWPKGRAHTGALVWFAILTVSYLGTGLV